MTVIPDPKLDASGVPLMKSVPMIATLWLVAPWPRDEGFVEVTVGAASTVNALLPVALLPSPLVTVTVREPSVADPEIEIEAVNCVALT